MRSDALRFLFGKYGTTADTKYGWFFNMAANKADLTTNFNGNFLAFFDYQKQFLLGQTYAKIKE